VGAKSKRVLRAMTAVCVRPSVRPSVRTNIYMQISLKQFEIHAWYQLPTNRKWPRADRMMTSLMT